MWTKHSYVCTNCDALIEITTQVDPVISPATMWCNCSPHAFVTRTALEPTVMPTVMSITPREVVKINSNPYN